MFIASSVFFAIYDAVSAARKEEGLTGHFRFDSPATAEKIRMACVDKFTKQVPFSLFKNSSCGKVVFTGGCLSWGGAHPPGR